MVGKVNGTADLNADSDTVDTSETSGGIYGSDDVFMSIFGSGGSREWSRRLGGANSDYGYGIAPDRSNGIVLTGYINGAADLNADGDTGDASETGGGIYGSEDVFITGFTPIAPLRVSYGSRFRVDRGGSLKVYN